MYRLLTLKKNIETILLFPFILAGRLCNFIRPLKEEYRIFFFFSFYHTGGAEKIHQQIVKATGGKDCIIYFTRHSAGKTFYKNFAESGCVIKDISRFTDNKWLYFFNFIFRGIISGYINRQKISPVVLNGQSNFGYKISPWIKKNVKQIELIHALNTFSKIRIPFISNYANSVTVSENIIELHKKLYSRFNIPGYLWARFIFIESKIPLPAEKMTGKKITGDILTVLYCGRSTPEKRPHIISALAKKLAEKNFRVRVEFAGDQEQYIREDEKKYCNFLGQISDAAILDAIYERSHILVIPSSTESGPLVFMEAMAKGMAIISTPVGYIPHHIKNGISGFVTKNLENEAELINEMETYISLLISDRSLLKKICMHNIEYAFANFGITIFNEAWQKLLSRSAS